MGELVSKIKGKAKQIEGVLTGNKKRQAEGEAEELRGKVEGIANKVEDAARKAVAAAKAVARKI